jgi:hypothetical protein
MDIRVWLQSFGLAVKKRPSIPEIARAEKPGEKTKGSAAKAGAYRSGLTHCISGFQRPFLQQVEEVSRNAY